MFPKYCNNKTLSTHLPTQKVATCQILSVKTKSIWQTRLSKFNNNFWKIQVKWINHRVLPILNILRDGDKSAFSRILNDREYQLTEPWLAKLIDKVVEEVQKCRILFP